MSTAFQPPGDCPNCGEPVPAGAQACPHCGADERTGWSDETYLDGVDLPEDDASDTARLRANRFPLWLTAAVVVALVLVLSGVWVLLR
jgi:hypothetical protein